ncbi:MAG: hypothetical protein R3E42_18875 [Burkholderiaceae bacterium]
MAAWLESYTVIQTVLGWLQDAGLSGVAAVFAPLLVLVLATPVIVVVSVVGGGLHDASHGGHGGGIGDSPGWSSNGVVRYC